MDKYDGLLSTIASRYHILKGAHESENAWKTRLIYSICGMMAYASLWDKLYEVESPSLATAASAKEPVSLVHLRQRIRSILASYKAMYPEIANNFPNDSEQSQQSKQSKQSEHSEQLENELKELFLSTGVVYHSPYRIAPAMRHEESCSGILFQRGIALDDISQVSGIGFYSVLELAQDSNTTPTLAGLKSMFGLAHESLQDLWLSLLSTARWTAPPAFTPNTKCLSLTPPFIWENIDSIPSRASESDSDTISLLRTGMQGSLLYYLYRHTNSGLEVSSLPQWQVNGSYYRTIACACLAAHGSLPPIEYTTDGTLVYLRLKYLLPPHELAFVNLYSWPTQCALPYRYNFERKLSTPVFTAIKQVLSDIGYKFKVKEGIN